MSEADNNHGLDIVTGLTFTLKCRLLYTNLLPFNNSDFSEESLHRKKHTVYPRLNAPGGVTNCKKAAKRLFILFCQFLLGKIILVS